ncbi:MAG: hypothetical protein HC901_00095 [Bdellovibrionaceae bacterium]|nr:hypothetical protein [Pseudobdellovibrionaceae bacterium]
MEKELWQVTDPTATPDDWDRNGGGTPRLSSAVELYLETDHTAKEVTGYSRQLDVIRGLGTTTYQAGGVTYTQEAFASYPANCFAVRLTTDQKESFLSDSSPNTPIQS